MKILNPVGAYLVTPVHTQFALEHERIAFVREQVKDNRSVVLFSPVSVYDIDVEIDIVRSTVNDVLNLHLFTTCDKYFSIPFIMQNDKRKITFDISNIDLEKFENEDVMFNKIGFSSKTDEILITFKVKELTDADRATFISFP